MNSHARLAVVVAGGYGVFGRRLCTLLARNAALQVVIAGRDVRRGALLAAALRQRGARATLDAIALDARSTSLADTLARVGGEVVVNVAGPFQDQDYRVAEACLRTRCHYIDLADARDFVCGIGRLDDAATGAGVLVTTGASSVPALSTAVVDELARAYRRIDSVDIGISPGNRTERGEATVAGILRYCGEPLSLWRDGCWQTAYGWAEQKRHRYPPPVGWRRLALCDVPDLTLLPARFPGVASVVFRAGLELSSLHLGLAVLSALHRRGLLPNLRRYAAPLSRLAGTLRAIGTDAGAMHVELAGEDRSGSRSRVRWTLVAERGDGPFVPTLVASALVAKLAAGTLAIRGALPCVGLVDLADVLREANGLAIRTQVEAA
jgi:saccharopine dehydrogenase-like NADP-dependent oxidoreductase